MNFEQTDSDWDGIGDVCDTTSGCGGCGQPACEILCNIDNDAVPSIDDNCPNSCNLNQLDADSDGIGDVCDDTTGCDGCGSICEIEC